MKRQTRPRDIFFPDRIISNMIRDYQEGRLDNSRFLYQAVVIEVDSDGGKFEKDPPRNPRNSIKARIITNSYSSFLSDENLPIFWPLFSHDKMPINEGEHVYVLFEDEKRQRGIWLTRSPEPLETDNKNYSKGIEKYKINHPQVTEKDVQGLDSPPSPTKLSKDTVVEDVPKLKVRNSDRVIEGSNNAVIIVGRDRPSDVSSGNKEGAGTIDIVVGRAKDDVMDMKEDKARIYISMNTDPDTNFDIIDGTNAAKVSAVVLKANEVRIVTEGDMKISSNGDIFIGRGATESAVLGDELLKAIQAGPLGSLGSIPILSHPTFIANVQKALSKTVKVKK